MNKSVVYLFVSALFLFASCEYRLGENFEELERIPVDSVAEYVDVYGSFAIDVDGTYVAERSSDAACQIYPLPGFKVEKVIVRLGEMEWENAGARCDFRVDVDRIPNGTYELSCEIFARTNKGTVAGQAGLEQFVEKRSWPFKVMARIESDRLLEYRMTEAGYPEIFWEVDESCRAGFDYYTVECTYDHSTYIWHIRDFDRRSFVDELYKGSGTYRVYIYFKDETIRPYSLGQVVLETSAESNLENTPGK